MLEAERGVADANVTDAGTALWWALTTITTVGYGDHYPVSGEGKIIAAGLMICGIALLGAVTASLASWLVDAVSIGEHHEAALMREVRGLRAELADLRERLVEMSDTSEPSAGDAAAEKR